MGNFFTDVISADARFSSPARMDDLTLLEPGTRTRVAQIIDAARKRGVELMVWETFRSKERQMDLFNRGASKLREVGVHHYGLAVDLVKVINRRPSWEGSFGLLGELAREHGLIWGGDWGAPELHHPFVDPAHLQRCAVARQVDLFLGRFYPSADYDPRRLR